jgi:foldase protein PrsA
VFKLTRYLAAPGAVLLVAAGLAACGGGVPSNAAVQVGGMPITKTALAHWMGVAAASSSATSTTEKSKPPIPEPPDYTACIAHLETAVKPVKGQPAPSRAALKSQCEQQYQTILREVLGFLISAQWVIGEGAHLGVHVSDQEVHKQFTTLKTAEFPKAQDFEKFLASSGQTVSDVLLRVKLNLLSTKIQQKVVKSKAQPTHAQIVKYYNENRSRFGHQSLAAAESTIKLQLTSTQEQAALSKFVNEFKKKWTAETDCRAGYVVPNCKQYKAPKTGATGAEHP